MDELKNAVLCFAIVSVCFTVVCCLPLLQAAPTTDSMVTVPGTDIQCPSRYYHLNPNHTMCQRDVGTDIPLTEEDKRQIVRRHNEIRTAVRPLAADMAELVWDDDLATVAAKWARQCKPGHDDHRRDEPKFPGTWIGQNAGRGYDTVLEAIDQGWYTEIENFTYGVPSGDKINGHYIQLIFANSTRVGCGMADCRGHNFYPRFQICNYAPGTEYFHYRGEPANRETRPYVNASTSCSMCSHHCNTAGTLCDCGGKVCFNDGYVDVTTCNCVCSSGFTGQLCENKHCPADVGWKCDYYWANLQDPCSYTNVLREDCPHKCGFC